MAGPHQYGETVAVFFMLLALNLAVRRLWPAAAGLALGLAAGARVPTGLALPALLALFGDGWRPTRSQALVLAGIVVPALAIGWYNLARFVVRSTSATPTFRTATPACSSPTSRGSPRA